jgi:hypothetical protein
VPVLGTAEVFAFGEGIAMQARLRFKQLPAHLLPRNEAAGEVKVNPRRVSIQSLSPPSSTDGGVR